MSEKVLCETEIDPLAQARDWVAKLIRLESRGAGDQEDAMRRLSVRYGIDRYEFWKIKYRPPKDVGVRLFLRLRAAYLAECDRQMEKLKNELEVARLKGVPVADLADQAEALVAIKEKLNP